MRPASDPDFGVQWASSSSSTTFSNIVHNDHCMLPVQLDFIMIITCITKSSKRFLWQYVQAGVTFALISYQKAMLSSCSKVGNGL